MTAETDDSSPSAGRENVDRDLLAVYVGDHWAAAGGGARLARRLAQRYEGSPWGPRLERLAHDVEADETALTEVRDQLGLGPSLGDRLKRVGAVVGERLSTLKLNGRLASRSPLTPLIECEAMMSGIAGKHRLWVALDQIVRHHPGVTTSHDLAALAAGARDQLALLDEVHTSTAATAVQRS